MKEAYLNFGIWLDSKKAILVQLHNGAVKETTIHSGVESRVRYHGETRQFTRMGKQYFTFEKKKEEIHKHELESYFKKITEAVKGSDSVMIMGPAEVKTELHKYLRDAKHHAPKVIAVETEDQLTDKQVVAKVKAFFGESAKAHI